MDVPTVLEEIACLKGLQDAKGYRSGRDWDAPGW